MAVTEVSSAVSIKAFSLQFSPVLELVRFQDFGVEQIIDRTKSKLDLCKNPFLRAKCGTVHRANIDKGRPLPKFGEWDVNDPSSAEGFTVIFNKARNEKKGGAKSDSPGKDEPGYNKNGQVPGKPTKKWFCCIQSTHAE
ncbi:unnamed protein product [Arabis nemorensis]|uniref:RIN4 pathogenic type III effector avirulence factor Avr cleavage site domain-containing protein n=1 Tax=Arabis nemorensis TaxID=586526 RepID=A0A565BAD9_9BRAS|nr:unnamed protein product [Arabis nemorensis]